MSFGVKLYGGFGVMLALLLLLSTVAWVVVHDLNADLDRAANVTEASCLPYSAISHSRRSICRDSGPYLMSWGGLWRSWTS
jgi:hypothetical protein